jgi:predicted enzyme involved in methoxymalonyl-ACP biosynthesis
MNAFKLIKLAKKYKVDNPDKIVTVLGSYSTQFISSTLGYILNEDAGLKYQVIDGEYDSIASTLIDDNSEFYQFKSDYLVLIPDTKDIYDNRPDLLATQKDIDSAVNDTVEYYKNLWGKIQSKSGAFILQANFVSPNTSQLGNLEANYNYSFTNFIKAVNLKLAEIRPKNVLLLDFDTLAGDLGKNEWFDYSNYFLTKQGFKLDFLPKVVNLIKNQFISLSSKTKKCLVLDLDNTLWGGVVGDDGFDGIQLDPNNAIGESYRNFQNISLTLKSGA